MRQPSRLWGGQAACGRVLYFASPKAGESPFYAEYTLLLVLFGLVAAHGAYFGRKLVNLAEAEQRAQNPKEAASFADRRRALQWVSSKVSWLDLAVSLAVVVLAVNS